MKLILIRSIILALILALLVAVIYSFYISFKRPDLSRKTNAASDSNPITSQTDWELGTLSNISTTNVPNSIEIDNLSDGSEITLSGHPVTASPHQDNAAAAVDNNLVTYWGDILIDHPPTNYWTLDLESTVTVARAKVSFSSTGGAEGVALWYSINNTDWSAAYQFMPPSGQGSYIEYQFPSAISARYWKMVCVSSNPAPTVTVYELKFYSPASATHISAPTQITNDNLYQWQTFSPTFTEPANTDISFKFRTSTDSINWTAWTASQTVASGNPLDISALLTSKIGDPGSETFYKYIQVESTLTSTDGVSTPTLADYTIGYHTNVKPAAPTAQTVTIGS